MSNANKDRKPLNFYLEVDYPITFYPEEAGGFTVMIKDLPGCMSQGETLEEAFEMIAEARELWIETAYEFGDSIPLPHTMATYSGKTMLRMPIYLHERLARHAKEQGTSLNQYLVALLSERDSLRVVQSVKEELAELKAALLKQEETPEQKPPASASYVAAEEPTAYATSENTSDETSEKEAVEAQ